MRIVVRGRRVSGPRYVRRVSGPRFPCLASVGGLANYCTEVCQCYPKQLTVVHRQRARHANTAPSRCGCRGIEVRVPRLVCTTQRRRRITASRSTVSCATRDSNPNKQAPGRSAASNLQWQARDTRTRARTRPESEPEPEPEPESEPVLRRGLHSASYSNRRSSTRSSSRRSCGRRPPSVRARARTR